MSFPAVRPAAAPQASRPAAPAGRSTPAAAPQASRPAAGISNRAMVAVLNGTNARPNAPAIREAWPANEENQQAAEKPSRPSTQARDRQQRWRKKLEALRSILNDQERRLENFDRAAARTQIDAALDAALSGITGDERAARLEEIRIYVDALPSYFGDHVINAVHARVDKRGPQIGIPGVGYLPPGKTEDLGNHAHIVSRGISEVVRIEGKWYTPVYQTVFGDALAPGSEQFPQGGPKHKDASQGAGGQVELHSGSAAGSDVVYWCSIGRPLRQLKWMDKYALDPRASEPLIRSFLIPLDVADAISGGAVTEHKTGGMNLDLIVDKHYERNQFGVVKKESFEQLRQLALPGSLRTYTDKAPFGRPDSWGEVRPAAELREQLGVPNPPIPGFDVFVDTMSADGFTKKEDYPKQADTLMRIHAYYTGNEAFLPEIDPGLSLPEVDPGLSLPEVDPDLSLRGLYDLMRRWLRAPDKNVEKMPRKAEREPKVRDFFLKHKPDGLNDDAEGLAKFMNEYVAPWATQARIAQEISDDYDVISGEKEDKDNPVVLSRSPAPVYFAGTTAGQLRGQRRPAAVKQSREQQALLAQRESLLKAYEDIGKVFKHDVSLDLRKALGQLKHKLDKITKDYDFYIGRVEVVAAKLLEYRNDIHVLVEEVAKALPARDTQHDARDTQRDATWQIVDLLRKAVA